MGKVVSKPRNSNIEILRIIAIAMVVISHYSEHGIWTQTIMGLNIGFNRFLLEMSLLGDIGSIIFVLISGYYLSNSSGVKYKKIIHLIFQVFFYSFLIYIIFVLMGLHSFSFNSLIKYALPLSHKVYWFASAYVILYLFHPYINKLLSTLSRKELLVFIATLLTIFSIVPTITNYNFYGNELIQFFTFYCIGAYLYKYPNNNLGRNKNDYKLLFMSILIIILSIVIFDLLGTKYIAYNTYSVYFMQRTSPFAIAFGVALFSIFSRKKVYENKFINILGLLIFGVYLLSDNKLLRSYIWIDLFKSPQFIYKPTLILHMLFAVILTMIGCLIIEAIRKYIIEKYLFRGLDKKIDQLQMDIRNKIDSKKID